MARSRMARLFPTLPPSASSASTMAAPHQRYADVVKFRSNRSMRLVDRDPHRADAMKSRKDGIGNAARGRLNQPIALSTEGFGDAFDDLVVRDGVDDFVGACSRRKINFEVEVDRETLPHPGLVRHDAVIGVQRQAADEYAISHRAASIAALTRKACTVSATSWARTIAAPFCTASRWAEIEPPMRPSGDDGVMVLMKRLRDAPTKSGNPKRVNSPSRARQVMLCSGVLPKPIPGSSTIDSRAMPAWAAISSEREKKAITSETMSISGSALSRLCITMTGTSRLATSVAMSASRCKPHTSLTMAAPMSIAQAASEDLIVSIETGKPSLITSGRMGARRAFSSSADTGTAPPYGRVDSAPTSRMSAPSFIIWAARAFAAVGSRN